MPRGHATRDQSWWFIALCFLACAVCVIHELRADTAPSSALCLPAPRCLCVSACVSAVRPQRVPLPLADVHRAAGLRRGDDARAVGDGNCQGAQGGPQVHQGAAAGGSLPPRQPRGRVLRAEQVGRRLHARAQGGRAFLQRDHLCVARHLLQPAGVCVAGAHRRGHLPGGGNGAQLLDAGVHRHQRSQRVHGGAHHHLQAHAQGLRHQGHQPVRVDLDRGELRRERGNGDGWSRWR